MKKILAILSSLTLIVSGSSSIMAMSPNNKVNKPNIKKLSQRPVNYLKVIEVPKTINAIAKTIELSKTTSEIDVNDSDTIQILNGVQLSGIEVKSSQPNIVHLEFNQATEEIIITGINEGHTDIIVSANHAKDVKISVTVNAIAKTIELSKTTSEITRDI